MQGTTRTRPQFRKRTEVRTAIKIHSAGCGALEAEEESGLPTQRQRNEFESLEEHYAKKLVLGNGVVHHSHESWLLRSIIICWEGWRMAHVSAETADEGLFEPALDACVRGEAPFAPSSRACEKDRKSSSSKSTSCRLAAEYRLQPIQQKFGSDVRELGNVESFELCDTVPKVQCSHCLLSWNQGIVYCICGQCLIDSESRRTLNKPKTGCTLYLEQRDKERT